MCLGIPGQVVEMTDPDAYLAKVDVNGIKRDDQRPAARRQRH